MSSGMQQFVSANFGESLNTWSLHKALTAIAGVQSVAYPLHFNSKLHTHLKDTQGKQANSN